MKKRIFLCIILAIIIAGCVLPMTVYAADNLPDIENINYVGAFGTVSWSAVNDTIYDIQLYNESGKLIYDDGSLGVNYINLFDLGIPSGSYFIYIYAYTTDGVYNTVFTNATTSTVFYHKDNFTPTVSWNGSAVRSSITNATVQFTLSTKSNDCTYYYAVVESGAAAPTIDTSGAGFSAFAGDNTVNITNLTSIGAYDLYLVVKEPDGDISETVMTTIPACTDYVMVNGVMLTEYTPYYVNGAASATDDNNNYNAYYNVQTDKLYLSNAVITQGYNVSGVGTAGIYTPAEITIYIGGDNTISGCANGIVADKPLTVSGGGTADASLTYSVKSYVYAKQGGEGAMAALAKATYNYGKAAKAFISAQ